MAGVATVLCEYGFCVDSPTVWLLASRPGLTLVLELRVDRAYAARPDTVAGEYEREQRIGREAVRGVRRGGEQPKQQQRADRLCGLCGRGAEQREEPPR